MKIEFQNGSKIESIETTVPIRGRGYKHFYYIDETPLKWWQKIYLKIYYHWVSLMFKCGLGRNYRR